MDEILHHFETIGNHCLLAFAGESPIQGFLSGAGFRPSTVVKKAEGDSWFTWWLNPSTREIHLFSKERTTHEPSAVGAPQPKLRSPERWRYCERTVASIARHVTRPLEAVVVAVQSGTSAGGPRGATRVAGGLGPETSCTPREINRDGGGGKIPGLSGGGGRRGTPPL